MLIMPSFMETYNKRFIWFHLLDLAVKGRYVNLQNYCMDSNNLVDSGLLKFLSQLSIMDLFSPSQITQSSLGFKGFNYHYFGVC